MNGTADLSHGYPDLMGPARQQAALHQGKGTTGLQGLIERHSGLAPRDRAAVEGDLLFGLIL